MFHERNDETRETEQAIRRAMHGTKTEQAIRAVLFCVVVALVVLILGLMTYL